jgi:hypothetical protein
MERVPKKKIPDKTTSRFLSTSAVIQYLNHFSSIGVASRFPARHQHLRRVKTSSRSPGLTNRRQAE